MDHKTRKLSQLKALAELLDSTFSGPFGIRFGLDALLGLIPGVGDVITSCLSLYILVAAGSLGVGAATLSRMAINILVDSLVDMIPLFGNLFDFYWKSNVKNIQILEAHLLRPEVEAVKSRMIIALVGVLLLAVLIASSYVTYLMLSTVATWLTTSLD